MTNVQPPDAEGEHVVAMGAVAEWRRALVKRWRIRNRLAYMSPYQARLNRWLWLFLWAALGYATLQHVVLADRPASSQWAFHTGELCYDLAIAYAGAFVFYVLVVRLPLRRDRRTVYGRMAYALRGPRGQARELMIYLNMTAGLVREGEPDDRKVTRENVAEACAAITHSTAAFYWTAPGRVRTNAMGLIVELVDRIHRGNNELMSDWSSYLPTDAIDLLEAIDDCTFLRLPENMFPFVERGVVDENQDLGYMADEIYTYLRLVHRFDKWRAKFVPVVSVPPGLPEVENDDELLTGHYNYTDPI
jgi:hypothetical protein